MLALACCQWGWRPQDVWDATPIELARILKGAAELQKNADPYALSGDDIEYLRAMMTREQHVVR